MQKIILVVICYILSACATTDTTNVKYNLADVLILAQANYSHDLYYESQEVSHLIKQLSSALVKQGVRVYDENNANLNSFKLALSDRSPAELLQIAREQTSRHYDYVLIISAGGEVTRTNYSNRIRTEVTGELVRLNDDTVVGLYAQGGSKLSAASTCLHACISQKLGDSLNAVVAGLVPDIIADLKTLSFENEPGLSQLAHYQVFLDGFNAEETKAIVEYLVAFDGYQKHKIKTPDHNKHRILYLSTKVASQLNLDLEQMLEKLELKAKLDQNDSQYHIVKQRHEKGLSLNLGLW